MANKKLEVKDLQISFKTDHGLVRAVRNISFDLYEGETLCIVGESGSGKSVTSKAIMGILANNAIIDNGSIMYNGENLLEVSEDEFYKIRGHKIGMIFQDPLSSLNPIVRIGKQITEATLINSNKLKLMYNDLISEDLIAYKNANPEATYVTITYNATFDGVSLECELSYGLPSLSSVIVEQTAVSSVDITSISVPVFDGDGNKSYASLTSNLANVTEIKEVGTNFTATNGIVKDVDNCEITLNSTAKINYFQDIIYNKINFINWNGETKWKTLYL